MKNGRPGRADDNELEAAALLGGAGRDCSKIGKDGLGSVLTKLGGARG